MDIIWLTCSLALAGISTYITLLHFYPSPPSSTKILVALVLFVVFHLLPVHLAAIIELNYDNGSVSQTRIVLFGCLIFLGLLIYSFLSRNIPYTLPRRSGRAQRSFYLFHVTKGLPTYLKSSLAIIAATLLIFAIDLLTSYPSGFDALNYHFPVATRWLQNQSLQLPPYKDWNYCLPGNAEVSMMIMLGSGYQSIATAFNFVAFLIGACAVYIISFRITENIVSSFLTVVLFSSIPIIQFQAFTGYVDLYGSAFLLAGVAIFLSRLEPQGDMTRSKWYALTVFISSCAWGVAIGTKPTFYVYTAVCFFSVLVFIWAERKHSRCSVLMLVFLMTLGMLLPSLFWFIRAFDASGNPFYPLTIEVFGRTFFFGLQQATNINTAHYNDLNYVRSKIEWLFYPWIEYRPHGFHSYSTGSGLGAVFSTFMPLGLVYGLYVIVKNITDRDYMLHRILMGTLLVMILIWWSVLSRSLRFGIPLIGLACILTAPLFGLFVRKQLRIFSLLIVISLGTTCIIAASRPTYAVLQRILTSSWERSNIYGYPPVIDHLPKDSVVWNSGAPVIMHFSLAGNRLTNKVIPKKWGHSKPAAEFVRQEKINYIVDVYPFSFDGLNRDWAHLIFDGEITSGRTTLKGYTSHRWRVWMVDRIH